jgi:hypothetical protein
MLDILDRPLNAPDCGFVTASAGKTAELRARTKSLPESGQVITSRQILRHQTRIVQKPDRETAILSQATVNFSGPFRVILDDGTDVTPGSPLRQAILAVLTAAPDQIRARKSLQDMFWGSADPARAAASLRSALYLLRQDLAVLGPDWLRADRLTVGLQPGRLLATDPGQQGHILLEGMDLALDDCEGFEDWLRGMRQTAADVGEQRTADQTLPSNRTAALPDQFPRKAHGVMFRPLRLNENRMALGILPAVQYGLNASTLMQADAVLDRIAAFLAGFTLLPLYDLRSHDGELRSLPITSALGPTHWLQPVMERSGIGTSMRLRLVEAHSRRLLWLSDPIIATGMDDTDTAIRLGETITDRMRAHIALENAPDLFPFTAVAALFSLNEKLVEETETTLIRMINAGGHPVLNCLLLFAQVFKVNESLGKLSDINVVMLCDLLGDIPQSDPLLPLCQSLVGYAVHMLTSDNDLAFHLVDSAHRLAPNLALNLDHLAVLRLVRGDLEGAEQAFGQLCRVGSQSPWRYTYDVTGAMIFMLKGDLRQSLHFANQAIFRKPRYLGALRYSMVGFAMSERPQDAARMMGRIETLRPGYDVSSWTEGLLRRMPADLAVPMVSGLRRAELV